MKKKLFSGLLLALLASGCAGPARESIPVVDAGGASPSSNKTVTTAVSEPNNAQSVIPRMPIQAEQEQWQIDEDENEARQAIAQAQQAQSQPQQSQQVQQASIASPSAPVQALLRTAQQQQASGDLNGAAASLERAQRIAPREPRVLYRLAEVRLAQGDAKEAEQLAQRGLSLSSDQPALQAGLWDLIGDARETLGDLEGAAQARSKARVQL